MEDSVSSQGLVSGRERVGSSCPFCLRIVAMTRSECICDIIVTRADARLLVGIQHWRRSGVNLGLAQISPVLFFG